MPPATSKSAVLKSPAKVKKPSRAKAAAVPTPAKAKQPFSKFTLFSKFPPELQLIVWKMAMEHGRIITLKAAKVPVVFHICSDSRREAIKAGYQIHIRDMKSGLIINPQFDILHLDRASFPNEFGYHIHAFHTIKCRNIKKAMLKPVQRLAFSMHEVLEIWKTQCFHCFLLTKPDDVFPELKELIIILRPGPLGAGFDDLYEVNTSTTSHLESVIEDVKKTFKDAQEEGALKGVKLRFMRTEKWVT